MRIGQYAKLSCEEPFRIFFPVGVVIGLSGVLLWPLFYMGITSTYPATVHARFMSEGFLSCFIFGFLGTAGPRVLSAQPFSGWEVSRLLALVGAAAMAHFWSYHALGGTFFTGALIFFAASLIRRFRQRQDSPPPNFSLVATATSRVSSSGSRAPMHCDGMPGMKPLDADPYISRALRPFWWKTMII